MGSGQHEAFRQFCVQCDKEIYSHNEVDTCSPACFEKWNRLLEHENRSYELAAKELEQWIDGSDVHDPEVNEAIDKAVKRIRGLKRLL